MKANQPSKQFRGRIAIVGILAMAVTMGAVPTGADTHPNGATYTCHYDTPSHAVTSGDSQGCPHVFTGGETIGFENNSDSVHAVQVCRTNGSDPDSAACAEALYGPVCVPANWYSSDTYQPVAGNFGYFAIQWLTVSGTCNGGWSATGIHHGNAAWCPGPDHLFPPDEIAQ